MWNLFFDRESDALIKPSAVAPGPAGPCPRVRRVQSHSSTTRQDPGVSRFSFLRVKQDLEDSVSGERKRRSAVAGVNWHLVGQVAGVFAANSKVPLASW